MDHAGKGLQPGRRIGVKPSPSVAPGTDVALARRLKAALAALPWCADVQFFVEAGTVTVAGFATGGVQAEALCALARKGAGLANVHDSLVRVDAILGSGLALG